MYKYIVLFNNAILAYSGPASSGYNSRPSTSSDRCEADSPRSHGSEVTHRSCPTPEVDR